MVLRRASKRIKRRVDAVATALGIARRGFHLPYRYAAALPQPGTVPCYDAVAAVLRAHEGDFRALLSAIEAHAASLRAIGTRPPPDPRWDQDWFPGLDAAAAYTMVRETAPHRIVEVGSGHSTRFLARAIADATADTRITAIDPAPRADIAGLGTVELDRRMVHQVGLAPFEGLGPGDILFVDSSHLLMPGSDVDFLLNRVIPILPAGVLVHIHDIFLPDDYPVAWSWRGYNEQSAVAGLLTGHRAAPLFASHYIASYMAQELLGMAVRRLPCPKGAHETSLWLRLL